MIRHLLKIVWHRKRMNALLMAEIFFSFLVLFAVATGGLYLLHNHRQPLGFDYEGVWNIRISIERESRDEPGPEHSEVFTRILRAARSVDQVIAAAGAQDVPYDGSTNTTTKDLDGRRVRMLYGEATDDFADVMGLDLIDGRWFQEGDEALAWRPVVINRMLARDLFGDEISVGRLLPFQLGGKDAKVIGLLADYRKHGEFTAPQNFVFVRAAVGDPAARPTRNLVLKMRPGADAAVEEELLGLLQPMARDFTLELRILSEMRETKRRLTLAPLLVGGLVAGFLMLMVGLGLIGVLWQNVTQRTREIGLRRATGAHAGQIRKQILGELWILTALGLALGAIVLVQLPLLDLASFLPASVFWTGMLVAAAAIYVLATLSGAYPSWLATRVQPAEALHYE